MQQSEPLFEDLAEFEAQFFQDLIRGYARLDIGMRGFLYHRIRQVVKEVIDLLKAPPASTEEELAGTAPDPYIH